MKKSFNDMACYVCLVLTAIITLISGVLPSLGISIGGSVANILYVVRDIALLLGVSIGALAYAKKKSIMTIIFWISVVVIILNSVGII